MKRRHLLARAGIGSVGSLAGCLGSAEPSGESEERTRTDVDEDDAERDRAAPAIDDRPCPPYDTVRDRAVCSHTVDPETAPVSLEPSPERSVLADGRPADEIALTLSNRSTRPLTVNPYSWTVWHDSGTGWEAFWQEYSITGHRTVSPGDSLSWTFAEAVESVRRDPELEPGLYAVELGVPKPSRGGEWIGCIALVRLESPE